MTTYTQLATDVNAWAARDDLTTVLPSMVGLFESRVNRKLRVRQMEAAFSGATSSNVIALPTDFLQFKELRIVGDANFIIYPQSLNMVRVSPQSEPSLYAVDGTNVRFNADGSVEGIYYQKLPGLVANGYNWLSVLAYDAYLFGVLSEVYGYLRDDTEQQKTLARSVAILDSIEKSNQRLSGPLRVRVA